VRARRTVLAAAASAAAATAAALCAIPKSVAVMADEPYSLLMSPPDDANAIQLASLKVTFTSTANRKSQAADEAGIEASWAEAREKQPRLFDKSKFRLASIRWTNGAINIDLGLTSYKDYVGTNRLPVERRTALEADGERLYGDRTAFLSNALGVEAVLETSDGQIVLLRRSTAVTGGHGLYNGPSGHPEPSHAGLEEAPVPTATNAEAVEAASQAAARELFNSVLQEIVEETNVPITALSTPLIIGCMADASGKPDLLFFVRTALDAAGVRAAYAEGASDGWESDKLALVSAEAFCRLGQRQEFAGCSDGGDGGDGGDGEGGCSSLLLTCVTRAAAACYQRARTSGALGGVEAEADASGVRTFESVLREDAAFREAAASIIVDAGAEADALRRLLRPEGALEGASAARLAEACEELDAAPKLAHAKACFGPWAHASREVVGGAVMAVIDELEAPHLLPSGIETRLLGGTSAAAFGLFTLLSQPRFEGGPQQ
jgi:hypothetical protein